MKFVLWALVIYLCWRWFTAQKKTVADAAPKTQKPHKADDGVELMVQCAQCGIHLPSSEAIAGPERKLFCSHEHSEQHHST